MKTALFLWSFFAFAAVPAFAAASAPSADEIVAKVDEIRNPSDSYRMKIEVQDGSSVSVFDVSLSGNTKTLVKTLEPVRDRGRNLLMLEENMWAYIPNLKRAVRVSLSQKLSGQAANGDISRMRWSGDYAAKIESQTAQASVIYLTAKKKGLTYDQLRVWVDRTNFHPLHAEFLTPAGKPLKTAQYLGYKTIAGKVRPTQIDIQDAVRTDQRSTIHILEMSVQSIPASVFNQNTLGD